MDAVKTACDIQIDGKREPGGGGGWGAQDDMETADRG